MTWRSARYLISQFTPLEDRVVVKVNDLVPVKCLDQCLALQILLAVKISFLCPTFLVLSLYWGPGLSNQAEWELRTLGQWRHVSGPRFIPL